MKEIVGSFWKSSHSQNNFPQNCTSLLRLTLLQNIASSDTIIVLLLIFNLCRFRNTG